MRYYCSAGYDKNGERMSDILLKLIMANTDEKMRIEDTARKYKLQFYLHYQEMYLF